MYCVRMCRLSCTVFLLLYITVAITAQVTEPPPSTCVNGEVRLAGLSNPQNGRVEVCFNNLWGTICDDDWDDRDAQVICRQLGYSAQGARGYDGSVASYGPGIGPIYFDNVDCSGSEDYLVNCSAQPVGDHNCNHFEDAGVLCEDSGFSCEDGEIRLQDGGSMYEGRVEVCLNNKYSTVCARLWGNEEASVICRQLGFTQGGTPYATPGDSFGRGVGEISWSGLNCNGSEANLTECARTPSIFDVFCSHLGDDVGVLCPRPDPQCADGEVRLSGGRTSAEGYVEICFNSHWGTVCHNGWDSVDANVLCGELGFTRNGSIAIGYADFGRGDGLVFLSRVACNGTEANLKLCPRSILTEHSCSHSQDAGVICVDANSTCTDGAMRLVDGKTSNEGRLEICFLNHWGTVCDDRFDSVEAALVCRELGFGEEGAVGLHGAFFGEGVGLILVDDTECIGNETTLLDCSHLGIGTSNCFHNEDVSVLCQAANSSCVNGEIRLVNGSGAHSGRVEVCFNGRFGTVCDDNWGSDDAAVVCNQLGYTGQGVAIGLSGAFYGQGTGPIFLDNAECSATNHSTLLSCFDTENEVGVHNCDHSEDAAVICPLGNRTCGEHLNGDVRLVGGSNQYEGRVEVCLDGEWGTICDNFWSDLDAAVVCTQLTHGPTDAQSLKGAYFGPGNGSIHLDRFFCRGEEQRLTDCIHFPAVPGSCSHSQDVGVVCSAASCSNGDVRLVDGKIPSEGRVEICINYQFGTVCDDQWDSLDAAVVCRQLGYNDGLGAVALPRAFFGQGEGRIFLDDVRCNGNETTLLSCDHERDPFLCFHFEDAGVICQSSNATDICSNGDIRLVRGQGPHEGNVEVCFTGNWGTVCHDRWDTTDARTVCNILGFESTYALPTRGAYFGPSDGIIFLDEVSCVGNETSILQCLSRNPGDHDCSNFLDAGVICSVSNSSFTCQSGDIRLMGGSSPSEGRVEVCFNGEWGTVCDDLWGDTDAAVVCSALGFAREGAQARGQALFGQGSGPIFMSNLGCRGSESNLLECELQGPGSFCSHIEDAGVICKPISACTNGDIRLVDGQVASEGTIELCTNGEWGGTVCDDLWDNSDAAVVCRQLGHASEGALATHGAFFGLGTGPISLTYVLCTGNETSLFDCPYSNDTSFCLHFEDAGVICPTNDTLNCTSGAVRLADGNTQYEGRVELCLHGRWGTVCDDRWDSRDAAVVCRQLGYTPQPGNNITGVALAANRATFGPGEGFIILDELNCNGTEASVLECRARELGAHNCRPTEDASAYCPYPAGLGCVNGDVRLVDGASPDRGRVEYCVGGVWNTICADSYWSNEDAQAVCRQLGFQAPENAVAIVAGGGSGPIQIAHLECTGDELRISDCPLPDFGLISLQCSSHVNDAGVVCTPVVDNTTCADGDLRLVDGAIENEGRVEVCFKREWGTICDDMFGKEEAIVICRQLGYTTNVNLSIAVGRAFFGRGFVPIHLDEVACIGNESSLLECSHSGVSIHNCNHNEDAGVICIAPNSTCSHGDLRLVNGPTEREGRLEVCLGGRWGTVCDDLWDTNDATVVCRQLGYLDRGAIATGVFRYGQGTGLILLDDLQCIGTEERLLDCPSAEAGTHNCHHSEDVGVICQELSSPCTTGEVRLVGGPVTTEGTVEICVGGQWGSVCSDGWDHSDATVLCNSLGFTGDDALAVSYAFFGFGSGVVVATNFNCSGTESSLLNCSYTSPTSCSHSSDAGVICPTAAPRNCSNGDVRLVGGSTYQGHVEVCLNGYWISVCSSSQWGVSEASIVCRQLGHTDNGDAIPVTGYNDFGLGSLSTLVVEGISCTGNETNLFECQTGQLGQHSCRSYDTAGVFCPSITSRCENGAVRLADQRRPHSGRVEVCVGGEWLSMCAERFFSIADWTNQNARVVCRQLGYTDVEDAVADFVYDYDYYYYHFNPYTVFPYEYRCDGDESSLFECDHIEAFLFRGFCSLGEYAGVICQSGNDSCTEGDIRLVDGSTENEGRVEICLNSQWGTICDDDWGKEEAQVVCKQLGYSNYQDSLPFGNGFFGQGIVPIHLDDLQCTGNETMLSDCRHPGVGSHNCLHHEDAGVFCIPANVTNCTTGELRLVGGASEMEGRLEICIGGVWGTVCDDRFGQPDAKVVCRQLGYFPDTAVYLGSAYYGQGTGLIFLDEVGCRGNETSLLECIHSGAGVHNCGHNEDVSVRCSEAPPNGTTPTTPPTTTGPSCTTGEVRLVGGPVTTEGTVEICVGGQWGSVCSDGWDHSDATVVCNSLGFTGDDALAVSYAFFGVGSGVVVATNFNCSGTESSLFNCSYNSSVSCSHSSDAGVICPTTAPRNCSNGDVRLVGGDTYQGHVEVCLNGYWISVCSSSQWGVSEASIVCRQLGHTDNGDAIPVTGYNFGLGSLSTLVADSISCTGDETNLFECQTGQLGQHSCRSYDTAGVFCPSNTSSCENGAARLADQRGPHSGRVELCVGGEWLSLCAERYFSVIGWTNQNAKAVCRQLGYTDVEDAVADFVFDFDYYYLSYYRVFPYEYRCDGNESSLFECDHIETFFIGFCLFGEYAGVICQSANDSCTEGDIRLVDGSTENEGRVEICLNDQWGTICDDGWGKEEAQVVCKQLGYSNYQDSLPFGNGFFGQGIVPIHLDDLQCTGDETMLSDCRHSGVGSHNCLHHEDAGVFCIPANATNCTTGELRLVGGASEMEGRLEICVGGVWGTVCDDRFGLPDAKVVCRQLGYFPEIAIFLPSAYYGQGTGLIFLDELGCHGNETSLLECIHSGAGVHNCGHNEDVSVRCLEPLTPTTPPTGPTPTTPPTGNCVEGSLELRGGTVATEGTVQLCRNGVWGTVCDDAWHQEDAKVVCRQLGFQFEDAIGVRGAFFGPGEGPIHIYNIHCVGRETSLSDCATSVVFPFCDHSEDSGVICPPSQPFNCTTGAVRLRGGRSQYEGRVELCLHGRWGTVCDDSWDSRDAAVICRQLGYTQNGLPWGAYGARFGTGSGLILLDEVDCGGSEETLLGCRASSLGHHNCIPSEDAGVFCPYTGSACRNGEVRLVGGTQAFEGRPEVCIGGEWGTFCSDFFWDDREARTLCRQLGYTDVSGAVAYSNAEYGQGIGPIHMASLGCTGNESNILECQTLGGAGFGCTHANDAGIQCQRINDSLCTDGDIRLVNGVTSNEGRVDICFDNHWGTICDDEWGPPEATVVCRQLGYGNGEGAVALGQAYFGEGSGRIYLDNVNCRREEVTINDCEHSGVSNHNCGHSEDAGVICLVDNAACTYGDLRLVGGASKLEGRVEVCIGGRWGTVCDDAWDDTDASVVCRQLGLSPDDSQGRQGAFFGQGTGPIFFDQTECVGNESQLIDCPTDGVAVHNCRHAEDAAVVCKSFPCIESNFRLIGGLGDNIGIPQVCVNKQWGAVCADSFDSQTAGLICDSLGLDKTSSLSVPSSLFQYNDEGDTDKFDVSVNCTSGTCTFTTKLNPTCVGTTASKSGGVLCPSRLNATIPRVCRSGDIRLADGSGPFEGRVEVCFNNVWGTVCDDSWDDRAAAVVCRQLRQPTEGAYAEREGKYGPGVGPIYLDDVKCSGSESHLLECPQLPLSAVHNCDHTEDATAVCPGSAMTTASETIATKATSPSTTKVEPSVSVGGLMGSNSVAIIVPLVLIIVLLILIIIVVVIIFIVYKARKSGKLTFGGFEDERPIVSSQSFSSEIAKEDIAMTEKTDQL